MTDLALLEPYPIQQRPAPVTLDTNEPTPQVRIRALMLAEWHGLIAEFLGPVDADTVAARHLRYLYVPAGDTLEQIEARGGDIPTFSADEVLPHVYALAVAWDNAHRTDPAYEPIAGEFRYRDDLA